VVLRREQLLMPSFHPYDCVTAEPRGTLSGPMSNQRDGGSREPTISRTPCPVCAATEVMLGTQTDRFVYLRCRACSEVWSIPDRRRAGVRRMAQGRVEVVPPNDLR